MLLSHKRLLALLGALALLLLTTTLLYMAGMHILEGKTRGFWESLQWSAGTISTTGYGGDTTWQHPIMVIYVVVTQFIGVILLFLVFPIYLIPFLEDRFETRLPKEISAAKNHVVIFDYGPPVATLLTELERAHIATVVVEESEADARHLMEQGHQVIHGNLDEGVLEKTYLLQARALIVNSTDDRNAATILAARQLGYQGEILALVEDPYHRQPIILAGASGAYTPRHVLGAALAARASQKVSPTVAGIQHLGRKLQVAEARITRDSILAGKTLAEADLGQHAGVTVIGQWAGGK
ncbi:MAG TPA: NAD-binding protein, partial [Acidobacteriota bacterium]|nr:NAD-binding protein [Acidobacteriota bacterium]